MAGLVGCNPATIAKYINVDIYGKILTYSAITGAVGGVWNYDMFTKMRAILAAESRRADQAEKQSAEYRQQVKEERLRRAEEHRQRLAAESRRRAEEHREQMCQNAEIHRARMQQDAELQRAMLAALTELTAVISQLRQEHSGNRR